MKQNYTITLSFDSFEELQNYVNKNNNKDANQKKLPVAECNECGKKLEGSYGEAVKEYSLKWYGKTLCQDCQKKFKKLEETA